MKKIMAVLTVLMCFASINAYSQEVRGIETRRVIYEGPEHEYSLGCTRSRCVDNQYYGWELKNRNSCTVSVDVSLWSQAMSNGYTTIPSHIVKSQTVILEPGELYVFKREEHPCTWVVGNYSGHPISNYYLEYKAYKLQ